MLKVARATVQSRLDRMQASGVIGSWAAHSNPDLQRVLDAMIATKAVLRSSAVSVPNTHRQSRTLPLPEAAARGAPG